MMIPVDDKHTMLGFEGLMRFSPDIFHFVTTRQGGCSRGNYASLNCTHYCGDDPKDVARNKELLLQNFPIQPVALLIPHQVHGTEVQRIEAGFAQLHVQQQVELLEGVDALVTDVPGVCLCVSTADCVPVLLYDLCRKVVAVAHAGWRGTVAGILSKTLGEMIAQYGCKPSNLWVGIGPSISATSFEVGEEVYEAFQKAGFSMDKLAFRHSQTDKWHIDLWEANRLQALEAGVPQTQIEVAGICTYQHPEQFFSARRLGIKSGRILTGIQLNFK